MPDSGRPRATASEDQLRTEAAGELDRVFVRLVVAGRVGVTDEERQSDTRLGLEASAFIDASAAASTDELAATVDYRAVIDEIRRVVTARPYSLLESLAEAVALALLDLGAVRARVRVVKPDVAEQLGADEVGVEVVRSRR